MQAASLQAISTPDRFGYWWNDSESFYWYDAALYGVNTQIVGDDVIAGPFDIGFNFPFYRNNYANAYISSNGFLTFIAAASTPSNSTIPNMGLPNAVIAPFWDDLVVNNPGNVFYLRGGTAPNRYFVVEWLNVSRFADSGTTLTFELILYESGQIVFQYYALTGTLNSSTIGIEDPTGTDGLLYRYNTIGVFQGIRFYRPQYALGWGLVDRFITPGVVDAVSFNLYNSGVSGADVFDLDLSSSWPGALLRADGITPLTDSDADGIIDTGSVGQGSTVTVTLIITPPVSAVVGNANHAILNIRSSRQSYERQFTVQQAVPAPFAQIYVDNTDGILRAQLSRPAGQTTGDIATREERGYGISITTLDDGRFLAAWSQGRCLDVQFCNVWVAEIKYAFLDRYGRPTSEIKTLINHDDATIDTYDEYASLAAAPSGVIGIIWRRHLYDPSQGTNQNLWFVPLNQNGEVTRSPINLTNNTAWNSGGAGVPSFYDIGIAATANNRFVMAWVREHFDGAYTIADVYFSIRNTTGDAVLNITKLTGSVGGSTIYIEPALATLDGNRVAITVQRRQESADAIFLYVIGSDGAAAVSTASELDPMAVNAIVDWNNWDVVQLSNKNILAIWEAYGCYPDEWKARLRYVVLDPNFNLVAGPICLPRATTATGGENFASVTADANGNGILTWEDLDDGANLYYALLGGNGEVVTPPMILQSSQTYTSTIWTSRRGAGNAPVLYSAGAPAAILVTSSQTSLVADGVSQTEVAAIVRDRLGAPVIDTIVQFSTSQGVIGQQALTDSIGRAVVELTSDQTLGVAAIQATVANISANTSVAFVAGPPAQLAVVVSPSTLVADGVSQADVTATLHDAYGHPLSGVTINFNTTTGAIGSSAITNADGQAIVRYTAGTNLAAAVITASASGLNANTTVQCVAGPPASIQVTTSDLTLVADGVSQTQVTVLVRDRLAHPVAGVEVTFSANLGSITRKATTDAQGFASAIFTVGDQAGVATIEATYETLTNQVALTLLPDHYNLFLPALTKMRPPAPQLVNGDLESGPGVGWQELVNGVSGQLIYAYSSRPIVIPQPLSGNYVVWLGGTANQMNMTNDLQQTITLPSDYTMKLRYHYYIASNERKCTNDNVVVWLAGIQIAKFELCKGAETSSWQTNVINLDSFKGVSGVVSFTSQLNGSLVSNFFIDNIQLCSDDPVAPSGTLSCMGFN